MIKTFTIFGLVMVMCSAVYAAGRCPRSADRLEEFSGCMVPVRGGSMYAGTAYELDEDHTELLTAMQSSPIIPYTPSPGGYGVSMPSYTPIYPLYDPMNVFYPPRFGAYVYSAGANPAASNYWYIRLGTPMY